MENLEFKGTKGDWSISSTQYRGRIKLDLGINKDVVDLWHYESSLSMMKEFKANAKLIIAAPDLLEALQQCVDGMKILSNSNPEHLGIKQDIEKAQKAIEKALK